MLGSLVPSIYYHLVTHKVFDNFIDWISWRSNDCELDMLEKLLFDEMKIYLIEN